MPPVRDAGGARAVDEPVLAFLSGVPDDAVRGAGIPVTDKIDFKRSLASYRAPRGRFGIVDVPEMGYLMVDGHGDPNSPPAYADALEALYPVADRKSPARLRDVRLRSPVESRCVQTLHDGPRGRHDRQAPGHLG